MGKDFFHTGVKSGNIIEIDKNGRDELYYPQSTLRAWYDDMKEKLLEDYYSGKGTYICIVDIILLVIYIIR